MPYVEVAGHRVWHEVTGQGDPVVLLHGAFGGVSSFGAQSLVLAGAGFEVFVPERRRHVRTPDRSGPITYDLMAADTIAYLEQEVAGPAHLVGWSDGAVVGMLVAMRRPDLVRRAVLVGQYYDLTGMPPGTDFESMKDPAVQGFLRQEYDALSPDGPDHWEVVFEKIRTMITTEPQIPADQIAGVEAETLLVQGDRDLVTVEHTVATAAQMPHARWAVLPGSHALPLENPGPFNALVISFLRDGVPAALM